MCRGDVVRAVWYLMGNKVVECSLNCEAEEGDLGW